MRTLVMGGQACVFYGAAEFSRDLDLVVLADPVNLDLLHAALAALDAECIAMPPFEGAYLARGHAVHFRCRREGVAGLRVDAMSKLRGLGDFEQLWKRRVSIPVEDLEISPAPGHGTRSGSISCSANLRTGDLLSEVARRFPGAAEQAALLRPAVRLALAGESGAVDAALAAEEAAERETDRAYWEPLERELDQLRRTRP